MQSRKIQWIIIVAKDYKVLKEFYADKLGFQVVREVPEDGFVQMQIGNQNFAIYQKENLSSVLPAELLTDDFTRAKTIFSFNQSDNIEEDYESMLQEGIEFILPPTRQPWGQITAYFKDPEGNIWELQKWE